MSSSSHPGIIVVSSECLFKVSLRSAVMLKILQARVQQYMNCEIPDVKPVFRKGRGTRDQMPTSTGSSKKEESSRKTSTSALLTMPKPLIVWIATNCENSSHHLTCLLINLYVGQEATVRIRYGSTDWFQIGKRVCQGCILLPCLLNLYA